MIEKYVQKYFHSDKNIWERVMIWLCLIVNLTASQLLLDKYNITMGLAELTAMFWGWEADSLIKTGENVNLEALLTFLGSSDRMLKFEL